MSPYRRAGVNMRMSFVRNCNNLSRLRQLIEYSWFMPSALPAYNLLKLFFMNHTSDARVVACIPYYKCQPYIRRAVDSLLAQTHRNLAIVVLNDGDTGTPPWPMLAGINDPRLLRFDLYKNKGPYFALDVALNATRAPYLLIQDADDYSHPQRVARLLAAIEKDRSGIAVSAQPQFRVLPGGSYRQTELRWQRHRTAHDRPDTPFLLDQHITPQFRYRIPHAGLVCTKTVRALGGYYGGFRITADVLLTNVLLMAARVSHVPLPLYHRFIRQQSLTHSPETGIKSAYAAKVKCQVAALYQQCYTCYARFVNGAITSKQLTQSIHAIRRSAITGEDLEALGMETARLLAQYPCV